MEATGLDPVGLLDQLETAVDRFTDAEFDRLDNRELLDLVARVERVRRKVDASTGMRVIDRLDATGAYGEDGDFSATVCVKRLGRLSGSAASRRVGAVRALRRLPLVAKSYAAGDIPTDHVVLLGRVARNPRVAELFDAADEMFRELAIDTEYLVFEAAVREWERRADIDGAERKDEVNHRRRRFSISRTLDGTFVIKGVCAASQGIFLVAVLAAFEKAEFEADWAKAEALLGRTPTKADLERTDSQRRMDAVERIFRLAAANPEGPGLAPEVNIIIDEATFNEELARRAAESAPADSAHPDSVGAESHDPGRDDFCCRTTDGTPLTPAVVVMAAIVGTVRAIVIDEAGNVINHGRRKRLFTGAARHAVTIREAVAHLRGVTCFWPGCDVPGWRCQIDHLKPAARGGPTDHLNGQSACGGHNRLKEHGFWPRTNGDGTTTIIRPDGTEVTHPT